MVKDIILNIQIPAGPPARHAPALVTAIAIDCGQMATAAILSFKTAAISGT
jgi:hypothetical protein